MRLDEFHQAVASTLASKRLGTVVFVRYLLLSRIAAKAVPATLARLTQVLSGWLNQTLDNVYAQGSAKGRHVALTLGYRGGGTAQLAWTGSESMRGVDLMLLGNRGAMYHDLGDLDAIPGDDAPGDVLAWIERALRSGRPEPRK